MNDSALVRLAVGLLLLGVVELGFYVWYALALSKLFRLLGGESWKGWVPILNEAELLARGGVPSWSVVYYFIPVLQLYGLYLKVTAMHRINLQFGRGAGSTVLGVLIPAIWASLLAWGSSPVTSDYDRRVAASAVAGSDHGTGPLASPAVSSEMPTFAPSTKDASGYTIPQVASSQVASPPAEVASAALPDLEPTVVPSLAAVEPTVAAEPAAASAPALIVNPWAPQSAAPAAAPVPVPPPIVAPVAPVPSVDFPTIVSDPQPAVEIAAPPAVPPAPIEAPPSRPQPEDAGDAPAGEPVPEDAPSESEPAAESPALVVPEPAAPSAVPDVPSAAEEDDDDEFAATVVVDRRPQVSWSLVLDDGRTFAVTAPQVALGRKPESTDPDVQLQAISDTTRTLSKTHARLDLKDGAWTVTDLQSTNGVVVLGAGDVENLLDAGASAVVADRFILGKVGMRLRFEEGQQS